MSKGGSVASKGKASSEASGAWWDRDAVLSAAITQHSAWMASTRKSFEEGIAKIDESLAAVPAEHKEKVNIEMKLASNRKHAMKLVLSGKDESG